MIAAKVSSQDALYGKVVNEITGAPVAAASVYLSNTAVGTQTNSQGEFFLKKPLTGNYILVASSIGYKISETNLQNTNLLQGFVIKLTPETTDLKEIIVTPYEKNGWQKWGDLFLENFIGTSYYARSCKLKNHEVLKFIMRHKDSTLIVRADEPILIVNNLLGYELRFDLKSFELNLSDSGNSLAYSGHPFFKELSAKNEKEEKKFQESRAKVYSFSMMRFMRSLFSEKANEEFLVQQIFLGVTKDIVLGKNLQNSIITNSGVTADTIYEIGSDIVNISIVKLNNASGSENLPYSATPEKSQTVFTLSDGLMKMYFDGALQINIKNQNPPSEYLKYSGYNVSKNPLLSAFELKKNVPVRIYKNGNYTESTNLKIKGFWAWWEKLATMLPLDYEPIQ